MLGSESIGVEPLAVLNNKLPPATPGFDDIKDGPTYDVAYLVRLNQKQVDSP